VRESELDSNNVILPRPPIRAALLFVCSQNWPTPIYPPSTAWRMPPCGHDDRRSA